jgi:hypothetical protein
VFSTYLYTGNSATQTITNGIDLAGKGGLVWIKGRSSGFRHILMDTARGTSSFLSTNATTGGTARSDLVTSFTSSGFTLGPDDINYGANVSGSNFASWTFREAPKFFDIVTYTGDGTANRQIAHSLGVAPGMIIVKRTSPTSNWQVYHRSIPEGSYGTQSFFLNLTDAAYDYGIWGTHAQQTSDYFTNGPLDGRDINVSGATYVAYLYAHDTTADGLIQCGSFTTDPSTRAFNVTLGWEPQWVMIKRTDSTGNWALHDNVRGMTAGPSGYGNELKANTTAAEALSTLVSPNATGFSSPYYDVVGSFVYIAIRRGPMKTPTLGTSVFSPVTKSVDNTFTSTNHVVDLLIESKRTSVNTTYQYLTLDRLRGINALTTFSTAAEYAGVVSPWFSSNTGFNATNFYAPTTGDYLFWAFRRAPGFFDVVCYTGNGVSGRNINHNLGVVPEIAIIKCRSSTTDGDASFPAGWWTAVKGSGANGYWFLPASSSGGLNSSNASPYSDTWSPYFPSATTFSPSSVTVASGTQGPSGNVSGKTYVAYLFASCPGVSKVGSYTGNGSSQTINCGFAAGARFVMIKRTDSTGDWYVWDTARGIVAGNDPHLSLNTTAAEVTSNDTIDTDSSGFVVNQVSATDVNVNAATYIYLAIA